MPQIAACQAARNACDAARRSALSGRTATYQPGCSFTAVADTDHAVASRLAGRAFTPALPTMQNQVVVDLVSRLLLGLAARKDHSWPLPSHTPTRRRPPPAKC